MEINDDAMPFRSAAHRLRRAIRKGEIRDGITPEVVDLFTELLSEMADEFQVGNGEGAIGLLRDVIDAFDDDAKETE
jgi:hypothetical protein